MDVLQKNVRSIFAALWVIGFEAVILSSLFVFFNVGPQTKMFFDRISLFFWASMLGFFSNHFYIKQADRKISKILSKNLPEEETNRRIKKSGGTTLIPHFVLIVLIAIVIAWGKLGYLGGNIV